MANNTQDTTLLSAVSEQAVTEKAAETGRGGVEDAGSTAQKDETSSSTPSVVQADAHLEKPSSLSSSNAQSNPPPSRPSLVPLGSNHSQPTPGAPHPKKFSAVNINKKFLEKNSSASASSGVASASSSTKPGGSSARPAVQQTSSHSRLVTTKLTASPAVHTAGWSRPPSVAPSPATTSNSPSSTPLPVAPNNQTPSSTTLQLPQVSKLVQPQPRSAVPSSASLQKDKPVWGNVKPPTNIPTRADIQTSDFPTAAEVANASTRKSAKSEEPKSATDSGAGRARLEEADAFRGVHLDPNAHHWDEMEEDDDDFLGGVVEFGDGRQYKVESAGSQQQTSSPPRNGSKSASQGPSIPVSKEERFVDDFDRSWPRSRPSPPSAAPEKPLPPVTQRSPTVSPSVSHPTHSPQESSRVLFNERSNRLEPYNQRQGPFPKRTGYQESTSPIEPRSASHSKPVHDPTHRRRFSGSSNGYAPGAERNERPRDRDSYSRREGPPPSPRLHRNAEFATHNGIRGQERQLPPHLSPNIPLRRLPSQESRRRPSDASLASSVMHPASQSPVLSQTSALSPNGAPAIPLPLNGVELDEVRKDVMHSAAERAKQRRQQEEAEREAQKERARRKALELEEKMKAAEAAKAKLEEEKAKEQEVISIIEDAVKSVEGGSPVENKIEQPLDRRRQPSLRGTQRDADADSSLSGGPQRRPSIPPRPIQDNSSPAAQVDSWRSKANPFPPPTPKQTEPRILPAQPPTSTPTLVTLTPSALEQVETIADGKREDLEVVEFSDMGKFVGVSESTAGEKGLDDEPEGNSIPKQRPTASDFFEEQLPSDKQRDFNVWRRKVSQGDVYAAGEAKGASGSEGNKSDTSASQSTEERKEQVDVSKEAISKEGSQLEHRYGEHINVPAHIAAQRSPRTPAFPKEASMSSLDYTISRIKGAIDASKENHPVSALVQDGPQLSRSVHAPIPPSRSSVQKDRWVPPALRSKHLDHGDEPREVFLVTVGEPPQSPPPTVIQVKFPSLSRPVEVIHRRQLIAFAKPPYQARLDILTFDPPVYGMDRKTLSLNDVLFRRPPANAKGIRYRVFLPRLKGPKVQIPTPNGLKTGGAYPAFGRAAAAGDGAMSWRKSAAPIAEEGPLAVDTMSRSPPPEDSPSTPTVASMPKSSDTSPARNDSRDGTLKRSQPKMPAGSAVAFYRDSRVDVVETDPKLSVNFIVGDLDDSKSAILESSENQTAKELTAATNGNGEFAQTSISKSPLPSTADLPSEKASPPLESKDSKDSVASTRITPDSSWQKATVSLPIKESPSRGPDPEHLKALWSQNSNKTTLQPVNSLEGIADDLTSVPFSLQDVKSEDGSTPPPLPAAPSRMSLHDVTKAFQQVPSSSSIPSQTRTPISPPTTSAPVARPNYQYSSVPPNMRPAYSYPSPMMSHSPSPVMYHAHAMNSSPVPARMQPNGPAPSMTPIYSQPMWMSMPPPGQGPNNMMRPMGSPYPAQMMAYPAGYPAQPAPPGNMMPGTPQSQNGGRGRNMPLVSPIMGHAHAHPSAPMYGGSPVMLHAMQVQHNHGYVPMPAGRGQQPPRTENGQMSTPQQPYPPQQNSHQQPTHPSYNPSANPSYARTSW